MRYRNMYSRPSNDPSVTIVKRTRYFRFIELLLCIICLILAVLFWTSVHALTITTVVIFATSLSFFIITLIDVIAGMSRNQYPITAWIGIAFLAAFMFFLSFGFLLFRPKHFVAIMVSLITAIVFLIDGMIILCHVFKLHSSNRVSPSDVERKEQKEKSIDENAIQVTNEAVQTDDSEPISESPAQVRSYATRLNTAPKRSFPVTTYGGTFPVGGKDAAPLPTPENLTRLETSRSPQTQTTRKSTREVTVDNRPRVMVDVSTQKPSLTDGTPLYPKLVEELVDRRTYPTQESSRPKPYETYESSEISSSGREVEQTPKSNQESEAYELDEITICRRVEDVQTETNWSYNPEDMQGRTLKPCPAAGEPLIQQPLGLFTMGSQPQDHRSNNCPSQMCQCCNRDLSTREQVTPFVSHHYDQSPCICGYTHYQASTVVRGAVRQYPQDTVHDQQKAIQDQLDQTRQVYGPHICGCNEETPIVTKERLTRNESPAVKSKGEYETSMTERRSSSNLSLLGSTSDLRRASEHPNLLNKNSASAASYFEDRFIFDEDETELMPDTGKRVTIADVPTSSSQGSTTQEYQSWLQRMMYNEKLLRQEQVDEKTLNERKKQKMSQEDSTSYSDKKGLEKPDYRRSSKISENEIYPDRTPTVIKLNNQLQQPPQNKKKVDDIKKKSITPLTITKKSQNRNIESQSSETSGASPPRKKRVVSCVRRCWEMPQTGRPWGTEITTTTTVRTTNFGVDKENTESISERSTETTYTSSKSPLPLDSSPEERSYISNQMAKRNEAPLQVQPKSLNDNSCFVPCCAVPSPDIDVRQQSGEPKGDELSDTEDLHIAESPLLSHPPADEMELKRRSILKNKSQIDEEIREELTSHELEELVDEIDSSVIERRKTDGVYKPYYRKQLEQLEEQIEQVSAEEVANTSDKWRNDETRVAENKIIFKKTCRCICNCSCKNTQMTAYKDDQRKPNKSFDIDKYYVTSLSDLPYHPRDDYKLDEKMLEDSIERRKSDTSDRTIDGGSYFWENPIQNTRPSRIPDSFAHTEWSSTPSIKQRPSFLQRLMGRASTYTEEEENENTGDASSVPKRGPVKRGHDDRK